ncbi:MAG TPA: hypothetical protein VNZ52_06010 [Candidatus Thermoplasmatota archaeon]|nr:hypothetical protein [Candidatus Thermoplasmatota archaeon]
MSTRTFLIAALLAVSALSAGPALQASHGGTHVSCSGGNTDGRAVTLLDAFHVDRSTNGVWQETNGVEGLQKSARTCVETDNSHRVIRSWEEYPADTQVSQMLPPVPGVPRCVSNICLA